MSTKNDPHKNYGGRGCPTWTRTKRMPASEAGALPIWLLGISNNNYYNRNIEGVKIYLRETLCIFLVIP